MERPHYPISAARKQFNKVIISFPPVLLLVLAGYYFLDSRIALAVKDALLVRPAKGLLFADMHSFLLPLVCLITAGAWAAYLSLARKNIFTIHTRFFQSVAWTMPGTYILKVIMKYAIGRIDVRYWLQHPRAKEFHWLHGGGNYTGFPSGHMAVFTAFALAVATWYPRYRRTCYLLLSMLAAVLIATDYHFLSDIIAGTYLGILVHSYLQMKLAASFPGENTRGQEQPSAAASPPIDPR